MLSRQVTRKNTRTISKPPWRLTMIFVCQLSRIITTSSECMPRLLGIVAARRKFLAAG